MFIYSLFQPPNHEKLSLKMQDCSIMFPSYPSINKDKVEFFNKIILFVIKMVNIVTKKRFLCKKKCFKKFGCLKLQHSNLNSRHPIHQNLLKITIFFGKNLKSNCLSSNKNPKNFNFSNIFFNSEF